MNAIGANQRASRVPVIYPKMDELPIPHFVSNEGSNLVTDL